MTEQRVRWSDDPRLDELTDPRHSLRRNRAPRERDEKQSSSYDVASASNHAVVL
jgi:hypothetical protein